MTSAIAISTLSSGYLNALDYAKSRIQGGELVKISDKTAPRVTIIHHPDVRRMLLSMRAQTEAARALAGYAAATIDAARELAGDLEGFSVLGVGAGTAKLTLEEHRAVDVALNETFARALRDSGKVRHLAFMSAVGADPTA